MKTVKINLLIFIILFITAISCEEELTEIENLNEIELLDISGEWSLVQVQGGLSETNSLFLPGQLIWDIEVSQITINNLNTDESIDDVFGSGTYHYSMEESDQNDKNAIEIAGVNWGYVYLTSDNDSLTIDQRNLDGLRLDFVRGGNEIVEPIEENDSSTQLVTHNLGDYALYMPVIDENGNEVFPVSIPTIKDLVYEFEISRQISSGNGFKIIQKFYYTNKGLIEEPVFSFNLSNELHNINVAAYYMLDEKEELLAIDRGLQTSLINISNSTEDNGLLDSTAVILSSQSLNDYAFGALNLRQMFGFTTVDFIPSDDDMISFNHDIILGPKLFDINVECGSNESLCGSIILEFTGLNTSPYAVKLNDIPNDELLVSAELRWIELLFVSPSNVRTSLVRKEYEFGTSSIQGGAWDLIFLRLDLELPEITLESNGELNEVITPAEIRIY